MALRDDPAFMAILKDASKSTRQVERETGVARSHVAKIRRELGVTRPEQPAASPDPQVSAAESASVEVGPDGGEFKNIKSETPITDWAPIFRIFNLDPDEWVVAEDTVRMSMWQQSRRLENGDRDVVNLYSYRAKFAKRAAATFTDADVERLRTLFWENAAYAYADVSGVPVAAVLNLADLQLGKGTPEETLARIKGGVDRFVTYVESRRAAGLNIDEIVVVNNGDPIESIAGNYANQLHTTMRGGLRAQMNLALDVWVWVASRVYPLAPKGQFVSVLCNHGQFGRMGGAKDAITGDSDNAGGFLAETLQRVIAPTYSHVKFTIPHDEMNVYADIAGVPVGFNHGHKIPGKGAEAFERWLGGQVRFDRRAYDARLWITAHKHHFASWDMGSAYVYQCPSCDDGSKWLTDATGQHARSGLFACLVGEHDPLGTSDAVFL